MMAEQISLALPPLTKYNGVPRRYEETKPAIIQDFSHRRILGLGHEIHLKLQGEAEEERLASVHATEEAVRKEAQALHEQEVLRVREEARLELERVVQKLKKEHDQALKKEALRVEMAMQKSALELVRQERVEAEKTLKDALAEAEVRMTSYREEVVRAVMEQEKRAAALEAARLAREHEETVRRVKEQASKELEETIARLTGAKDTAIQEAVTSAEKREQLKHAEDLAAAIVSYDLDLAKIRIEMDIQLNEINRLLAKIEEKEKSKQRLHEELQKTRRSFQDYITRVGKFTEGHANFMIKPLSESVLQLADEP